MAHERVVFDKAANATDDAQDEVVRWLLRRDAPRAGRRRRRTRVTSSRPGIYSSARWPAILLNAGDERRLRATYEAERALFAERARRRRRC